MPNVMFQDHWSTSFKVYTIIRTWQLSSSSLCKFLSPFSPGGLTINLVLTGHAILEKKMFENNGQLHVTSWGPNFFTNINTLSLWVIWH